MMPDSTGDLVRLPLPQGTHVRVVAKIRPDPPFDTGIIWKHVPEFGGYLVRHNRSPFGDGLYAGHNLFGWAYDELEVVPS